MRGQKNEAELWVEIYKSRISLKGADNEDSLRGSGLWGIICDEVASFRNWSELWKEVLRPALTDFEGFAWFIGTPKGFNHFYELYNTQTKHQDFVSFQFTTYDNPYLKKEEIDAAKLELSENAFAQEYLADFRKYTGLVYQEFDRGSHIMEPFDIPSSWRIYRAMDFGAIHPTVCLWIAVDNQDNAYIFDEYYKSNQPVRFHADIINAKSQGMNILTTWGDPSAEQAQLDYAGYGIYITSALKLFTGGEDWVNSGINKVKNWLKPMEGRPRLYVFKNCENTIREFESYRWLEAKEGEKGRQIVEKINDDCMDALRYFICSYEGRVIEPDPLWGEETQLKRNSFTGY